MIRNAPIYAEALASGAAIEVGHLLGEDMHCLFMTCQNPPEPSKECAEECAASAEGLQDGSELNFFLLPLNYTVLLHFYLPPCIEKLLQWLAGGKSVDRGRAARCMSFQCRWTSKGKKHWPALSFEACDLLQSLVISRADQANSWKLAPGLELPCRKLFCCSHIDFLDVFSSTDSIRCGRKIRCGSSHPLKPKP